MEDGEIPSDPVSSSTDKVCYAVEPALHCHRKGAHSLPIVYICSYPVITEKILRKDDEILKAFSYTFLIYLIMIASIV
jgi:hypothetical protein